MASLANSVGWSPRIESISQMLVANGGSLKRLPLVALDAGAIEDVDAIPEAWTAFICLLVFGRQLAGRVERIEGLGKVGAIARLHEHNLLLEIDPWRLFLESPGV